MKKILLHFGLLVPILVYLLIDSIFIRPNYNESMLFVVIFIDYCMTYNRFIKEK